MKKYWITWFILLCFTAVMLWLDSLTMARTMFVVLMIGAMLTKATMIAANFMHLWHERMGLVLMVVIGLFVTGVVLYVLIVPDAYRIHQMLEAARP